MTCPAPWILSMHADGELPPTDANSVACHAQDCAACRSTLAVLTAERIATVFGVETIITDDASGTHPVLLRPL